MRESLQATKALLKPSLIAARHPWGFLSGALVLGYTVGSLYRPSHVVTYASSNTNSAPAESRICPRDSDLEQRNGNRKRQPRRITVWEECERALRDELGLVRNDCVRFGRGFLRELIRGIVHPPADVSSNPKFQGGDRTSGNRELNNRSHRIVTGLVHSQRSEGEDGGSTVWHLLKRTFSKWNEDHAPQLGAALAYYTVFSLAPLLLIVIAIAGLVFGQEAAQGEIIGQIQGLVGEESAKAIQSMIEEARKPAAGIIATLSAIVMLLIGATGVFAQLQEALNTIWRVEKKPGKGIWKMLRDRFISLMAVFGTGFLLLISLVISAGLSAVGATLGHVLPAPEFLLQIINFFMSFAVITLLFAMIYKLLPDTSIGWNDVWVGAGMTSLLFTIGKFLIGLYLGKSDVGIAYGAAGSLVVILIWVYYASQIFLFGAEFTAVHAHSRGSRLGSSSPAHNGPHWRGSEEGGRS